MYFLDEQEFVVDAYGISNLNLPALWNPYDYLAWTYFNDFAYRRHASYFKQCQFNELDWSRGPDGNLGNKMMANYATGSYKVVYVEPGEFFKLFIPKHNFCIQIPD